MFPELRSVGQLKNMAGFSLPVAIFVVVILSMIAVAMSRLSETGSQSYIAALLSNRAFYAAESGMHLSVVEVLNTSVCSCSGVSNIAFTNVKGLSGCTATITCNDTLVVNGDTYCTVTSQGACDGSNSQRTVEVRVK